MAHARKRPRLDEALAAPPAALGPLLREPAVPVCVKGCTFHVHRGVLSRLPFFAAKLEGGWADAARPEVELPCTAEDFQLVLAALYSGRRLGSSAAEVPDFATAARLALALDFLDAEPLFPELRSLLQTLPRDQGEVADARTLPAQDKAPTVSEAPVSPGTLKAMLLSAAKADAAKDRAKAVLARCHSAEHKEAIAEAVSTLLRGSSKEQILWAGALAADWLDPARATAIFRRLSVLMAIHSRTCSLYPKSGLSSTLPVVFCAHLQRCAAQGVDHIDLLALGRDVVGTSQSLLCNAPRSPFFHSQEECRMTFKAPLAFDETCREKLAVLARSTDSWSLALELAKYPTEQLLTLITPELLQALGCNVGPLCEVLARSPKFLTKLTPGLVQGMGSCARIFCKVLAEQMPHTVLQNFITSELLQAMGAHAGPICQVLATCCDRLITVEVLQNLGTAAGPVHAELLRRLGDLQEDVAAFVVKALAGE